MERKRGEEQTQERENEGEEGTFLIFPPATLVSFRLRSSLPPSLLHFSREDEDKCGGREGRKGLAAAPPLPPFSQTGPSSSPTLQFISESLPPPSRSSYFSPGLSRRKAAPATGTKGATLPRRRPNLPGAHALPPWHSEPCAKPTQIFLRCDEKRKKATSPPAHPFSPGKKRRGDKRITRCPPSIPQLGGEGGLRRTEAYKSGDFRSRDVGRGGGGRLGGFCVCRLRIYPAWPLGCMVQGICPPLQV